MAGSLLFDLADKLSFSAQKFHDEGYCVIDTGLRAATLAEAVASAKTVAEKGSERFVRVVGSLDQDRRNLLKLYDGVKPFLQALYGGAKHPRSDQAPYGVHNMVQVAIREPGAAGQDGAKTMGSMKAAAVAHVDQPHKRQSPRGQPICNFSCLVGILLQGDTRDRADAGNLWVSRGSHIELGKAFSELGGEPLFFTPLSDHYLGSNCAAKMEAVRMAPGQAVIAHHQLLHAFGPNKSQTPRVQVYFRITATGRPAGSAICYPAAMRDPFLEMPRLAQLMAQQDEALRTAESLRKPLPQPKSHLRCLSKKQRARARSRGRKDRPNGIRAQADWTRKPRNMMSKKQRAAMRALALAA